MATFPEQFQGITVFGLYNDQTGDALFGVNGTAAPASSVVVSGIDQAGLIQSIPLGQIGQPVPATEWGLYIAGKDTATGDFTPLSFTGGNLNVNATVTPPSDSITTGSLTTAAGTLAVSTSGTSQLFVQITGTWTGTLTFQVSLDGTTWQNADLFSIPTVGSTEGSPSVQTTTANGNWTLPVGGIQKFRVSNGAGLATGSATINLTSGQGQYSVFTYSDNAANFLATVSQGTSPWVENLSQVAGVTLGATAVTAFGTAPAAVNVPAVNSSIFAGTTGITATGSSLNVNVTGSSGTTTVAGNLTTNNAAPIADNLGVLPAIARTTVNPALYTNGFQVLLVTDLAGNLNSDTQYWAGTALGAPTAWGTAPTGNVIGTNAELFSGNTPLTNTAGALNVNISSTTGGTLNVAGTLTNNNAAPIADNVGTLGYIATATPETYTQGNQVLATTSLGGAVRIVPVDEANAASLSYYEVTNGNTYVAVTTAFTPIIAFQTNSAAFIYLLRVLQVFTSGTVVEFVLLKNPTVTGGTFAAASGHFNLNTTATSYTGGTKVLGGYVGATPFLLNNMLDAIAAGTPGDTFAIEARSFSGTGNVVASIRWSEQTAAL